jgi:ribosomal protein S18 acetylase RimI-like enzyme
MGQDKTPETLRVREGTMDDAETIVAFNSAMARETEGKCLPPDLLRAGVRSALADPARARYLLADQAGQVIGQLMLTSEWSDWRNGQIWWIQSVYVRPDERRRGVFRALYEHVESLARRTAGVVGLRLYVEHNNVAAQQVYCRLGMQDAGYRVLERMF